MQVEVVVFLLFLFSGFWSVPSLPGTATGFVSDFLHVTLLLGSSFFLSRCIEEGKRVCFTFLLLNCSFALWYDSLRTSVCIQRALGAVVSSFRCRGVLSISATRQAAQPMFVRQRSSMLRIF